jgi:hypothetical protein
MKAIIQNAISAAIQRHEASGELSSPCMRTFLATVYNDLIEQGIKSESVSFDFDKDDVQRILDASSAPAAVKKTLLKAASITNITLFYLDYLTRSYPLLWEKNPCSYAISCFDVTSHLGFGLYREQEARAAAAKLTSVRHELTPQVANAILEQYGFDSRPVLDGNLLSEFNRGINAILEKYGFALRPVPVFDNNLLSVLERRISDAVSSNRSHMDSLEAEENAGDEALHQYCIYNSKKYRRDPYICREQYIARRNEYRTKRREFGEQRAIHEIFLSFIDERFLDPRQKPTRQVFERLRARDIACLEQQHAEYINSPGFAMYVAWQISSDSLRRYRAAAEARWKAQAEAETEATAAPEPQPNLQGASATSATDTKSREVEEQRSIQEIFDTEQEPTLGFVCAKDVAAAPEPQPDLQGASATSVAVCGTKIVRSDSQWILLGLFDAGLLDTEQEPTFELVCAEEATAAPEPRPDLQGASATSATDTKSREVEEQRSIQEIPLDSLGFVDVRFPDAEQEPTFDLVCAEDVAAAQPRPDLQSVSAMSAAVSSEQCCTDSGCSIS